MLLKELKGYIEDASLDIPEEASMYGILEDDMEEYKDREVKRIYYNTVDEELVVELEPLKLKN